MCPLGLSYALHLHKGMALSLFNSQTEMCLLNTTLSELDGGVAELHYEDSGHFLLLQVSTNSLELVKEQWSRYETQCLEYLNATLPATGDALSSHQELV